MGNCPQSLPLIFLPIKLYKFASCGWALEASVFAIYNCNRLIGGIIPTTLLVPLVILIALHFAANSIQEYLHDRSKLSQQLCEFSAESAACFDEDDRELVNASVENWFGSLEAFN